jgi:hypothetical protein
MIQGDDGKYSSYLDEPAWTMDQNKTPSLRARMMVYDPNAFLQNKQNVAFCICKMYNPRAQVREVQQTSQAGNPLPEPVSTVEDIVLRSNDMVEAFAEFTKSLPDFEKNFPNHRPRDRIQAPYMFWYQYRSAAALDILLPQNRDLMKLLTSWIDDNYGEAYDRADDQISRGLITAESVKFLVRPGDVVVKMEKQELTAAIATSWLASTSAPEVTNFDDSFRWRTRKDHGEGPLEWGWACASKAIHYDGTFYYQPETLNLKLKAKSLKHEVPIEDLSAFPIQYASAEWREQLERRGKRYWSCRKRRLVGYEDDRGFYGVCAKGFVNGLVTCARMTDSGYRAATDSWLTLRLTRNYTQILPASKGLTQRLITRTVIDWILRSLRMTTRHRLSRSTSFRTRSWRTTCGVRNGVSINISSSSSCM